jgi:hypothetical protein
MLAPPSPTQSQTVPAHVAPTAFPAPLITFVNVSAYMGTFDYTVYGDGQPYRVEVRRTAGDYERSVFNGDDARWDRDVVGAIDLLRRTGNPCQALSDPVVEAFNDWQAARHSANLARIEANPARYGEVPPDDALRIPPRPVRGAMYRIGTGWVPTSPSDSCIGRDSGSATDLGA